MVLAQIIQAAGASAIYAASGFLRKKRDDREFNWQKFAHTVIIGAIVGGFISYTGATPDMAMLMLESVGLTALIQNLIKMVARRIR